MPSFLAPHYAFEGGLSPSSSDTLSDLHRRLGVSEVCKRSPRGTVSGLIPTQEEAGVSSMAMAGYSELRLPRATLPVPKPKR